MCGSKLTWLLCGSEIDLILGWGSNWLDFSSGVEINLISVWGIESYLVLVLGSKVTCFLSGGSKLTVRGPKFTCFRCDDWLTRFLCGWWWSNLTRVLDAGRKSLGFRVSIEIDKVFVWVVEIDLISSGGSNFTWFQLGIGIGLVCVLGRKWLGFGIWIEIDLGFAWWCSTANRCGVLTDRCVGYVLQDHSVTVDWVAQYFIHH